MFFKVKVHGRQLHRIGRDMWDLLDDARSLSKLKILNWVMVGLEILAACAGAWHVWHEAYLVAVQALLLEIALLMIHAIGMSYEKQMHQTHENRADRLADEIEFKGEDLMGMVDRFGLRVRRWGRRMRWF